MLLDIEAIIGKPETQLEILADFFRTDRKTIERCDDSNGFVGDMYRISATNLFIEIACNFQDKQKISETLQELLSDCLLDAFYNRFLDRLMKSIL